MGNEERQLLPPDALYIADSEISDDEKRAPVPVGTEEPMPLVERIEIAGMPDISDCQHYDRFVRNALRFSQQAKARKRTVMSQAAISQEITRATIRAMGGRGRS